MSDESQTHPDLDEFIRSDLLQVKNDEQGVQVVAGFEGQPRNYVRRSPGLLSLEMRRVRIVLCRTMVTNEVFFEKWDPAVHGEFEDIPHSQSPAEAQKSLGELIESDDIQSLAYLLEQMRKQGASKRMKITGKLK